MAKDFLNEITRAEDILLGALGYDGDAQVLTVEVGPESYKGTARWPDGEQFEFESEWEPDELESWAIEVLCAREELTDESDGDSQNVEGV